jgi:hypothetical protein
MLALHGFVRFVGLFFFLLLGLFLACVFVGLHFSTFFFFFDPADGTKWAFWACLWFVKLGMGGSPPAILEW